MFLEKLNLNLNNSYFKAKIQRITKCMLFPYVYFLVYYLFFPRVCFD